MDSENMYTGASERRGDYGRDYLKLSEWLQQVLSTPERNNTEVAVVAEHDTQLHPVLSSDYQITFYQQLPDFCMALLNNEPQATVTYAPLLFHLAGCRACHRDYPGYVRCVARGYLSSWTASVTWSGNPYVVCDPASYAEPFESDPDQSGGGVVTSGKARTER